VANEPIQLVFRLGWRVRRGAAEALNRLTVHL
jgi:hypothetical protein